MTDLTTLFRRYAVHRTGYNSDDHRGVDGHENDYPPVAYISDLIRVSSHVLQLVEKWSPERAGGGFAGGTPEPAFSVVGRGFRDGGGVGGGGQRRDDGMVSRGGGIPRQQQLQQHWSRGGGMPRQQQQQQQQQQHWLRDGGMPRQQQQQQQQHWSRGGGMPRQQQQQQQWSRGGGIPHQHQRSSHAFPPARQARQQQPLQQPSRGIPTIGGSGEDGSIPLSETFFGGDGGAVEEWLQSDNMEMPMFSLLEGPQQLAPTAVALAATAPSAEAVTGASNLPRFVVERCGRNAHVVNGRGIGGNTCSSAADRRYCFPHCVGGGGRSGRLLLQMKQRHWRRHRRPAILFPRLHQLGAQSGRASRLLERCHRTRQRRRHRRPAILLLLMLRWRGPLESSR